MTTLQQNILARLRGTLPSQWFGETSPNADNLLLGAATEGLALAYSLLQDVRPQLRVLTATGGVLDLMAGDFFGVGLPRLAAESDDDYRIRILTALFKEAATKKAMMDAIGYYTGVYPDILEYGDNVDPTGYMVTKGDDTTSGYGALVKPYHAFITVYRTIAPQFPNVGGYGSTIGGYGAGSTRYVPPVATNYGGLFQLINDIKPIGTKIWARVIDGNIEDLVAEYGVTPVDPTIAAASGVTLTDNSGTILTYNPN